jgi:hypothetical protein
MATPVKSKTTATSPPMEGFDVTATIGHVSFSEMGNMSGMEAAMLLIAQHGKESVYHFPHEDGGFVTVHVEFERPITESSGNGRDEPEW